MTISSKPTSVSSLLYHASICFRIGSRVLSFGQRQPNVWNGFYGMDDGID